MSARLICTAPQLSVATLIRPSVRSTHLIPGAGSIRLLRTSNVARAETAVPRNETVGAAAPANPATTTQSGEPKNKMHGAYHWDFERALSIASIPVVVAPFIVGSHPLVDLALGVVIPLHSHVGFDACITDYFPKHREPVMNRIFKAALYGVTGLSLYGCYQFNTNDIGITEFFKRLWVGKHTA
ncbi:CybS-domain-containing protein [Fimicolochytrium jonesii]|uniref:CybS-domain-containing protein n=1 Tax=Fimicolochytrium jonesii TaxID=1396493 RepID=UPI0022FE82C3|nr:CybS-domain-containing protein [Fimicolochytrium jonesii]KAI8815587.1 CybS-domain-containing protein [Fimicolochytrium jonesii]